MAVRVVYPDEIFLVNAAIDYVILLAAAGLGGIALRRWRLAVGAIMGGVYSVAAALWTAGFLDSAAIKLTVGAAMCLVSFGGQGSFLKLCLVFFALSAGFAGAAMAAASLTDGGYISIDLGVLVLSFAVCRIVFAAVFRISARHHVRGEIFRLTVTLNGKRVEMRALSDTGNTLRDPVTGRMVIVCDARAAAPLFDRRTGEVLTLDGAQAFCLLQRTDARFRLLPYSGVGAEGRLMLAFRPDAAIKDGREELNALIGIAPDGIRSADGYSAIAGTGAAV